MLWLLACTADPGQKDEPTTTTDSGAPTTESAPHTTDSTPTDTDSGTTESAPPPDPPPAGATVIVDVTVVDVHGVQPHMDVILDGGRIWDLRATGEPYVDLLEIPAAGRFLVPGLVDAHVHLAHSGATVWTGDPLDANLRASLYHGVLSVYDVGGPDVILELRDAVAAGTTLGPNIRATGPFLTAVESHPCETWPDPDLCIFVDETDATEAGAARAAAGADAIKVALADASFTPWGTPRLDLEALAQITAGTLPVIAHVDNDADVVDAADAGVTLLAHPPFGGPIGSGAVSAAVGLAGVHSTVGAFAAVGDVLSGTTDLDDPGLIVGPGVRDNWVYVAGHPEVLLDGWVDGSAEWASSARANLAALHSAGATVLPGSDAGYYFVPHGIGLHRELAELVAQGWTPFDVLVAATATASTVLGFEGGEIVAGAPADLLLLTADPTADIGALGAIETVFRAGAAWPREDLRTVDLQAPRELPCLEHADCAADARCDALTHTCGAACAPIYDYVGSCDADSWCIPSDGVDDTDGVCHDEVACDLYLQDCAPSEYGQACVPLDVDTNRCWYGGTQQVGDACTWDSVETACAPGLYCSFITEVCYQLCDPDGPDTCPGPQTCERQEASRGVPWFGLCL